MVFAVLTRGLLAAALLVVAAVERPRPERGRLLQGQDRRSLHRLQRRRRLRPLCAHARAPHGQAHPRQSDRRAEEHGGRRQPAARQLALQRRRRRTARPSAPSAAAPASIRCSATQTAQFDATKFTWIGSANDEVSVCVAWNTSGITKFEDLLTKELIVGGTSAVGRHRPVPEDHQRRARHQDARSSPAIPAATTSTSPWSAARCRAAAAGRGRA